MYSTLFSSEHPLEQDFSSGYMQYSCVTLLVNVAQVHTCEVHFLVTVRLCTSVCEILQDISF